MATEPSSPRGRRPAKPEEAQATEVARVERWRGYASSTFVLSAADGTVYESGSFRWRRAEPPPAEGDARAAYDALVERLLADGWTLAGPGPTWYETSFERPVAASPGIPVQSVASEPPPPPPALPPQRLPAPEPEPQRPVARPVEAVARVSAPPAPPPAVKRGGPARTVLIAAAALAAGLGAGALLFGGGQGRTTKTVVQTRTAAAPPVIAAATPPATSTTTSTATTPAAPRPRPVLDIVIVGLRGNGSWVEARRGSPTGKLLYSGVVVPGHRLHLRGRTVWARFGAASNLSITVDGHPVTLFGTYDKTFRSHR